jgi:hypothetical protein
MFGGLNHANHNPNLQIGFIPVGTALTARPATRAIITMHPSMNAARTTIFWTNFRTIASNRTGRVLLYRILIEIRRHHAGAACIGDDVIGVTSLDNLLSRANCRSIMITWESSGSSFSKASTLVAPGAPQPVNFLA